MKSIPSLFTVLLILLFVRCTTPRDEKIVNPEDYEVYLHRGADENLMKCNEEMAFWNKKLSGVPNSGTYRSKIAGLYASRFLINGRIEDIHTSDSLFQVIQKDTKEESASIHRSLAANCITQHKFIEAREEVMKAIAIGEGKASSTFMLVDVNLELGDYAGAKTAMKQLTGQTFFPYLIREAKIKDHEGKLDTAIDLMEKALDKVKDRPSASVWALSNLADMYGHAGRIRESYQAYLQVLKQNPDYDYALKGIAWIAFSNDHNYSEAKRIVESIASKRETPDMHLFLAQIASAENNLPEKNKQLTLYTKMATSPKYGDMYNKYIALLEADEFSNPARTIEIANREIHNRPTPQSFDLLAWGYLQKGNAAEALTVAQKHIENKTFEPDALYHLGMIYRANRMDKEAVRCLKKAAESSFELGPAKAQKIKQQLKS